MRTTKAQRITAFLLAAVLLFCGTFAISAKDEEEDNALNSIKELLNAISYNEYQNLEEYVEATDATAPISVSGTSGVYTNAAGAVVDSGAVAVVDKDNRELYESEKAAWDAVVKDKNLPYKVQVDGKEGLYVPDSGTVTWNVSGITVPTKYNIKIEYYPVANKSASVERIFMINGKVPFAEARYLNISKVWTTPFPFAKVEIGKKMDADTVLSEAISAGFSDATKVTDGDVTYIQCKIPSVWTDATSAFVDTYTVRFFNADIDKNEIRESLKQSPEWQTYTLKDSNGFTQEPFIFVMTPDDAGNVVFSFEGVNEPVVISNITLTPTTTQQAGHCHNHHQIHQRQQDDGIHRVVGLVSNIGGRLGHVHHGHVAGHGRFLQKGDALVTDSGQNVLNGLGEDDLCHSLPLGKAQAACRLHLSLIHGIDTAADQLRHIGTGVDTEGHDGYRHAVLGGNENNVEEYQQQYGHGNTADHRGIQIAQPVEKAQFFVALTEILGDGNQRTDDHTDNQCAQSNQKSVPEALHHPHIAVVLKEGLLQFC